MHDNISLFLKKSGRGCIYYRIISEKVAGGIYYRIISEKVAGGIYYHIISEKVAGAYIRAGSFVRINLIVLLLHADNSHWISCM